MASNSIKELHNGTSRISILIEKFVAAPILKVMYDVKNVKSLDKLNVRLSVSVNTCTLPTPQSMY
jgi:hypothetical protein